MACGFAAIEYKERQGESGILTLMSIAEILWRRLKRSAGGTDRGHATVQKFRSRHFFWEARVQSQATPCGVRGGQSGIGTGFSSSVSVFSCQQNSAGARYSFIQRLPTLYNCSN